MSFIAIAVMFSFWNNDLDLQVETIFPSETVMEKHGLWVDLPLQIHHDRNLLFLLDQKNHAVYLFDLEGKYLRTIGGPGLGPGELSYPFNITTTNDSQLVVVDNQSKAHFFNWEGEFQKAVPILNPVIRLAATPTGFLAGGLNLEKDLKFYYFDSQFNVHEIDQHPFEKDMGKPFYNLDHQIRVVDESVYVLQRYDQHFRIFDTQGKLKRKGILEGDPFLEPGYDEMNISWYFKLFEIYHGHWVCYYFDKGAVRFMVFDLTGRLVNKVRLPMPENGMFPKTNVVYLGDFVFVDNGGNDRLFLAVWDPEPVILAYSVEKSNFIPEL